MLNPCSPPPPIELDSASNLIRHELNTKRNVQVLSALDELSQKGTREFNLALIRGQHGILADLAAMASHEHPLAREIIERWHRDFQGEFDLVEHDEERIWMRRETARYTSLLDSLETELGVASEDTENILIVELVRECNKIGPQLRSMIELSAGDEEMTTLLIGLNDRLCRVIARHREWGQRTNPFDDAKLMRGLSRNPFDS